MSSGRDTPEKYQGLVSDSTGVTTQRSKCHLYPQKSKQWEGRPLPALPTPPSACSQNALKVGQR